MNKKVLTLCAAMLLTGSLSMSAASISFDDFKNQQGVEYSTGVMTFTGDVELSSYQDYLLIDQDNITIEGNWHTLKGHIVVTGKNVTIKNLTVDYYNGAEASISGFDPTVTVNKTAISAYTESITITGCTIKCSSKFWLANAITIFPKSEDAKILIQNNTIKDAKQKKDDDFSSAIIIAQGTAIGGLDGVTTPAVVVKNFDVSKAIVNNTFEECATDYVVADYLEAKPYSALQIGLLEDKSNKDLIAEQINLVADNGSVNFDGKSDTFTEVTKDKNITAKVPVVCEDATILYNGANNPDDGSNVIIDGIEPAVANLYGYKLMENPSGFGLLAITAGPDTYLVMQEKNKDAELIKITSATELNNYISNKAALWQMSQNKVAGVYQYSFVNKDGVQLKANASAEENAQKGIFVPQQNAPYNSERGVVLPNISDNQYWSFGLYKLSDNYFTANDLIERYGDYFTLGITYKDEKNKDVDVTGVFAGQLRPVSSVRYSAGEATYVDATTEQSFMLVNGEGNIIVIDTKAPLFEAPSDHGYAFTTITPKQWAERFTAATLKDHNYVAEFKLAYDYNNQSTTEAVTSIEIEGLTVGLEKQEGNIILVADVESQLLEDPTISIKLNAGNGIAAKDWLTSPSYYTVEAINKDKNAPHYGKVLGLNESGYIDWVAPENVDLTKPEGQFAIDQNYHFTNREYKDASVAYQADPILEDGKLYKVAGEDNVYALVTPEGNDTLRITPITTYQSKDGFKRFTASELSANTYTVAMKSLMGDPFIIENHNDKHRLGLSADEYTEWRIEMPTVKLMDATDDFTRMAADTVKVLTPITYYVGAPVNDWVTTQIDDPEAKYYAPNTQLEICTYVLKNTDNGEYLDGQDYTESAGNAYYVCNADKKTATRIAFKENGEGTVNLVPAYGYYDYKISNTSYWTQDWMTGMSMNEVEGSSLTKYVDYANNLWLSPRKIIGGTSASTGVLKDEYLYKATTNDLFVIAPAEAPTYKKLAQGDKIILSLKNNTENVLVEGPKGELATISNREAHKDLNPTLYVDTAYVNRDGNYAYQYLLGVRINRVDTTYECNVPAHGTHRADTTFGYFLVNMIDSAKACTDVHNNKFVYNNEYKLDFVEGYHTNDTLFFTNEAGEVTSKMEVGNGDFNIAKYAFKMVDEFANEFVIETAAGYTKKYNMAKDNNGHWHWTVASVESVPGYLRWVNGNLVVTSNIDEAAHFTMEASDKEATANEAISAGNVVVAGVNGAVVVKGAEGKNVIVSTILGKVVANEVVSSDNAQITAPAGIVVVSVDGESFKVVVK